MQKNKKPSLKKVPTKKVTITQYSKFTQNAIKEHYTELKQQGLIKTSFQTYLNTSGQDFFEKFFVQKQKSAGRFRIETILELAHAQGKRFFIKHVNK
jgi:hypothetical protein